jgi:L-asparaginase II
MSNPVLVELTRGRLVESLHRGAVAVALPSGELMLSLGDVRRPVFPRSAIKAFQCLPLIESGAADRYGFGDPEIALACASHSGTERHVELARSMLARVGLNELALGCGAHMPSNEEATRALIERGEDPSALHNNCSGKHSGMLAVAEHRGWDTIGYWEPEHPVQQGIRSVLEEFTGHTLGPEVCGIDGCSAPNWAAPLADLARAFALFITGEGPAARHREAAIRITKACWMEPELMSGPGRTDAHIMSRLPGRVFTKTGAEGVYCGAVPALGVGFALKIDDGASRASEGVVLALVERLVRDAGSLSRGAVLTNWEGREVGTRRIAGDLARALDGLKVG